MMWLDPVLITDERTLQPGDVVRVTYEVVVTEYVSREPWASAWHGKTRSGHNFGVVTGTSGMRTVELIGRE